MRGKITKIIGKTLNIILHISSEERGGPSPWYGGGKLWTTKKLLDEIKHRPGVTCKFRFIPVLGTATVQA